MSKKKKDPKISGFKVHELAFEKEFSYYIPSQLKGVDPSELKKEYTRLRDIAQKRLKRLADSPFSESEAYKYNVDRFKKIKDIEDETELRTLLADLSKFVNKEASTIKGQYAIMARRAESLQQKVPDLDFGSMSPKEQMSLFKFMEWMVNKYGISAIYHISQGEQRALSYDEKIKEMMSKGDFEDAKKRMHEIGGEYILPEDEVTEEEAKKAFEVT